MQRDLKGAPLPVGNPTDFDSGEAILSRPGLAMESVSRLKGHCFEVSTSFAKIYIVLVVYLVCEMTGFSFQIQKQKCNIFREPEIILVLHFKF